MSICNEILQNGIYDYEKVNFEKSKSIWYINHFKNSNYQSLKEAENSSFNATIPIKSAMVELGFAHSEEGFQEFKLYIEQYISLTENEQIKLDRSLKKINPDVVQAWKECISVFGTHIWITHTEDPYTFIVNTRFNSDGNPPPKIDGVSYSGKPVQAFGSTYFNSNGSVKNRARIKPGENYQEIRRLSDEPMTLIIDLSTGKDFRCLFARLNTINFEREFDTNAGLVLQSEGSWEADMEIKNLPKNKNLLVEIFAEFYVATDYRGEVNLSANLDGKPKTKKDRIREDEGYKGTLHSYISFGTVTMTPSTVRNFKAEFVMDGRFDKVSHRVMYVRLWCKY